MSRQNIITQLKSYGRVHEGEGDLVDRFLRFVRENENCCERSLEAGHVTGSAWVVNKAESHVLLTHHKKLDRWLQLGGHADGDTDILSVALREAAEESGLSGLVPLGDDVFDIDIHLIPQRKKEKAHYHYDMRYAIKAGFDENFIVSEESHNLKWVEIRNIEAYTKEPSMIRMASKWASRTTCS